MASTNTNIAYKGVPCYTFKGKNRDPKVDEVPGPGSYAAES